MTFWRSLFVAASLLAAPLSLAHAQTPQTVKAKNVVLVHGAWADGSSWSEVIPILQAAGLNVTAVQNPLSSLADSVEATKRVLAEQDGPTVLVAHSWGGTVISQVGTDPEGHRPRLCRRPCARCQRGFCRAVEAVSGGTGTRRRRRARRLHQAVRRRLPEVLRQWR
ncbi:pimeloyl-ACP methyl ester carboxylesterase [Bradyrhizobium sp. GM6.1]